MEPLTILTFVVSIVTLSMSGVLMPGPITAVTVSKGTEDPHAGMWGSGWSTVFWNSHLWR